MAHADLKFFGFFWEESRTLGDVYRFNMQVFSVFGGSGFERLRLAVYPKPETPKPSMYVSP